MSESDSSAQRRGFFNRLFSGRPPPEPAHDDRAGDMRLRLAKFENSRVRDVMLPRAEIAAIATNSSPQLLYQTFLEHGHSRLPVYRDTLDDPVGFVHIKDFLATLPAFGSRNENAADSIADIIRPILFVPESMRLADLVVKMQSTRIHIALVIDEYGGTDGMVTLEDLIEQIFGAIEDEHDQDEALIIPRSRNVVEVDARASIDDLEQAFELSLSLPDYEDNIDTVGGLVSALAGRVPVRGEIISHSSGIDMEVIDADPRRIKRLRVCRTPAKTAKSSQ